MISQNLYHRIAYPYLRKLEVGIATIVTPFGRADPGSLIGTLWLYGKRQTKNSKPESVCYICLMLFKYGKSVLRLLERLNKFKGFDLQIQIRFKLRA